jgi:hypothetical protein
MPQAPQELFTWRMGTLIGVPCYENERNDRTMKQFGRLLILNGACLVGFGATWAQAPPGPLTPPPTPPGSVEAAPAPAKKPEVAPRKDILGAWRFNKDESDDPRDKLKQARDSDNSNRGPSNGPHVGFPGGTIGGGGPYGGHRTPSSSQDDENGRLGDLVNPVRELQVLRRNENDPEVEMIDDRERRHIFYTDGRKLEKQKDPGLEEVSAHWDGNRLVTDEKGPHSGKLSRTFEISSDGRQLLESVHVTDSKGNHPITVNYVYDAIEKSSLSFPAH